VRKRLGHILIILEGIWIGDDIGSIRLVRIIILSRNESFLMEFHSQISKLAKNAADRVIPFLELIQSINSNVVLIENHFLDVRERIERDRVELERCITEKNTLLQQLEDKIALGLEKTLTAAVATTKALMKKHQSSSDFNPNPRDVKLGATTVRI